MANKFVSALKKIGQVVLAGAEIYMGIEPAVAAAVPALGNNATFNRINQVIEDVEAVGAVAGNPALTSAQKLVGASALVSQEIASQFAGKKIADPALFTKGVTEVTQGFVDIRNSFEAAAATTVPIAGGPIPLPEFPPVVVTDQAAPKA